MSLQLENVEMMVGTMGKSDYLVIGERDGLYIGLKPVVERAYASAFGLPIPAIAVGIRLRVAKAPEAAIVNAGANAEVAYPHIEFEKKDDERASLFRGGVAPILDASSYQGVLDQIANDESEAVKLAKHVLEMLKDEDLNKGLSREAVMGWVVDNIHEKAKSMLDEAKGITGQHPVTGEVLEFKPAGNPEVKH